MATLKPEVDRSDIDKLEKLPTGLNNLKNKVDKLDVDKLVPVPVDYKDNKLSDALKMMLLKKDIHNAKIQDTEGKIPDIIKLATNTILSAKINEIKNEVPSITNLATTTAPNAEINEIKNKILNISNLFTNTALTAVENKTPDHSKYITTSEFNKLAAENFTARLKQANVATKGDIVHFVK